MVDGGFNIGEYTKAFLKKNPGFQVYGFEPLSFPTDITNITLIRKAIWIKNETKTFYLSERPDASSLCNESKHINPNNSISVECINFGAWILANFDKNDYVHLKLDIEGAEYEVLHNMIKDGSIKLVSELVCEWHHSKFARTRTQRIQFGQKKIAIATELNALSHLRWLQDWR